MKQKLKNVKYSRWHKQGQLRASYLIHIQRLQKENRELRDAVVEERLLRRKAYTWYQERLQSRFYCMLDMLMSGFKKGF